MLIDRCADQTRSMLDLGIGVEDVRADAQVLAARVNLYPFLVQLRCYRARLGVRDGEEGAVSVADARSPDAPLEEERGQPALLRQVVLAQPFDAEFEGELETGERLHRREHRRVDSSHASPPRPYSGSSGRA